MAGTTDGRRIVERVGTQHGINLRRKFRFGVVALDRTASVAAPVRWGFRRLRLDGRGFRMSRSVADGSASQHACRRTLWVGCDSRRGQGVRCRRGFQPQWNHEVAGIKGYVVVRCLDYVRSVRSKRNHVSHVFWYVVDVHVVEYEGCVLLRFLFSTSSFKHGVSHVQCRDLSHALKLASRRSDHRFCLFLVRFIIVHAQTGNFSHKLSVPSGRGDDSSNISSRSLKGRLRRIRFVRFEFDNRLGQLRFVVIVVFRFRRRRCRRRQALSFGAPSVLFITRLVHFFRRRR
mmetsp:Transcript_23710/g.52478  ORF Transcript_23710/g.52478 Transcript_23710/m.52478 type:complete len:288 (+) Transcript_23710:787-1650(+)